MEERQLGNVRVIQHDAVEVFTHMLARPAWTALLCFPDPGTKRHNKRRLIQPPTIALLASRINPAAICT